MASFLHKLYFFKLDFVLFRVKILKILYAYFHSLFDFDHGTKLYWLFNSFI
jgi:hypothetical protein